MATITTAKRARSFPDLDRALDRESYNWLNSNAPDVLEAVEVELTNGATPLQLRDRVISQYGREDFAARIEQAARHIQRVNR